MERVYSLSLHDLRISEGRKGIGIIEGLRKHFQIPLTIHLVFDEDLTAQPELSKYLLEQMRTGSLELVFHGITHTCSKRVWGPLAFFHKYQAEYLDNDAEHRKATRKSFAANRYDMKMNMGICPPCWLSSRENTSLFESFQPLYIEKLLFLHYPDKKVLSPVISLGSPSRVEAYCLKILAGTISLISGLFHLNRVRIAMHVCDLNMETSCRFFDEKISTFNRRGFRPVLLRELK